MPDQTLPLIVQSDRTLLLEVHGEHYVHARDDIAPFAELVKSPEHIHSYIVSPLSLWNAAAMGMGADEVIARMMKWSKYPVPDSMITFIRDFCARYGSVKLLAGDTPGTLKLTCTDERIFQELTHHTHLKKIMQVSGDRTFTLALLERGTVKVHLIKLGYPVEDLVPLREGAPLSFSLRETALSGRPFSLRGYQREAMEAFLGSHPRTLGLGYGTVVMPCGSGKTVIAIAAIHALQTETLVISTNTAAVHQWIDELLDKTTLSEEDIGEYTGGKKEIRPVTVCTYQVLTWRSDKLSDFPHFSLFTKKRWGLIVYDEVHLLPAPVFRITAEIQATRRLGMTATLVREDKREDEVFSLIGPKRYDVPWKELEQKGWIASAVCTEIRIPLPEKLELSYAVAPKRQKFRIASENPLKIRVAQEIIENSPEDQILVIGQYISQLHRIAEALHAPIITGSLANSKREELYRQFKAGEIKLLVVSKVANFAIDLPDASLAIQISGTFGSRQEEAQRLGRILRPKERNARFYNIVTRYSTEEDFAANRQRFLAEQGYTYHLEVWDELAP